MRRYSTIAEHAQLCAAGSSLITSGRNLVAKWLIAVTASSCDLYSRLHVCGNESSITWALILLKLRPTLVKVNVTCCLLSCASHVVLCERPVRWHAKGHHITTEEHVNMKQKTIQEYHNSTLIFLQKNRILVQHNHDLTKESSGR